jgi:hypothetical protein
MRSEILKKNKVFTAEHLMKPAPMDRKSSKIVAKTIYKAIITEASFTIIYQGDHKIT